MKKNPDLYIEMMRYGSDKVNKGVTYEEIKLFLEKKKFHIHEERLKILFYEVYDAVNPPEGRDAEHQARPDVRSVLSLKSTFHLLEYTQLEEARESSRTSFRLAFGALTISTILAGFSILTHIYPDLITVDFLFKESPNR